MYLRPNDGAHAPSQMKMEDQVIDVSMASAELNASDIQAVVEVLRSGRLALGPQTLEFEHLMADYVGIRHVGAASAGVHVSLLRG